MMLCPSQVRASMDTFVKKTLVTKQHLFVTSAKEVMWQLAFICLLVCDRNNSESYEQVLAWSPCCSCWVDQLIFRIQRVIHAEAFKIMLWKTNEFNLNRYFSPIDVFVSSGIPINNSRVNFTFNFVFMWSYMNQPRCKINYVMPMPWSDVSVVTVRPK